MNQESTDDTSFERYFWDIPIITPRELEEGIDLIERCPKGKNRNA